MTFTETVRNIGSSGAPLGGPSLPQERRLVTAIPGPKSLALMQRKAAAVASGVGTTIPIFTAAAGGGVVVDVDGNSLIDLGSGIAVTGVGNSNPRVVAAVAAQLAQFTHTCFTVAPYDSYVEVAEALNRLTPGDHAKRSVLFNSGAEAVENAVKIARHYTGKQAVVAFDHAYHGRTNLTMALTAKTMPYKSGFGPFAPEIYRAPLSYPYRDGLDGVTAAGKAISMIEKEIGASNLAAIVIEPIQGEGGFIVPAPGFLPALVAWANENNVVFIADEVQTGFARTGSLFASEHEGIVPDVIVTAKGIAGGLPLSAVTGRAEIMDSAQSGGLGGTYAGNPLACVAALATIESYEQDDLVERAQELGAILRGRLNALRVVDPRIGDVRGRGAMIAIELVDPVTKAPDAALTNRVARRGPQAGRHRAHVRHLRQRHPFPAAALDLRRAAHRGHRRHRHRPGRLVSLSKGETFVSVAESATAIAAETALLAKVPTGLFIGGEWRQSSSGQTLPVHDPATGAELIRIADATVEDGAAALDAAVAVADSWAATPPRQRAEILRRAFDLVQERKDEFALLMTIEMGKPLAEAYGEVAYGAEFLRWFSEEAVRISGRYGLNPEGTGRMIVSQRPVGPCFLITPWNFPLAMATRKIAPALAAGCTVVVKPAELTPLTTLYFVGLLEEAGLPAGVVNVITTSAAAAVSAPIIADPRLRKLSFTGSTPVGQRLLAQAAQGVLRTSMELGGNAPFLVFEDADLDKAVDGAMQAKFRNIGQACTAANRFIVHESVAAEFGRRVTQRVAGMTHRPRHRRRHHDRATRQPGCRRIDR